MVQPFGINRGGGGPPPAAGPLGLVEGYAMRGLDGALPGRKSMK